MKSFLLHYLSVGVLTTAVLSAHAETIKYPSAPEERASGVTLTPMVGQFNFDSDRNLDDELYTGIGIGYRFSNPYSVEFVYAEADETSAAGAALGDVKQYRLEMLYDIANYGNFTPYLSLGAAHNEFTVNTPTNDDEGALSAGLGAYYHFTDNIALRGDLRLLRGVGDTKASDLMFGLGLQFFLGKTKKAAPAPAPVAAVEKPAEPTLAELCAQAGGVLEAEKCVKKSLSTERVELNVQFEYNSDKVRSDYLGKVKEFADFMTTYPTAKAVIEGHTDATGSAAYNQNLSQRRVNEVVRLLSTNYNVAADRLSAIGYGETQPIAANDTKANRAKNRRVIASVTVEVEETIQLNVK